MEGTSYTIWSSIALAIIGLLIIIFRKFILEIQINRDYSIEERSKGIIFSGIFCIILAIILFLKN